MENITNNKKFIIGGIILCATITIGVGVYFLFFQNKQFPQAPVNSTVMPPQGTATAKVTVTPPPKPVFSERSAVDVTPQGFEPSTIKVKAGTLVTWINKSGQEVAIASDPHPEHTAYPPLNLGEFADGFGVSLIFDEIGTYGYHNHLNPGQTGIVTVE